MKKQLPDIAAETIENRIFTFRGVQLMVDRDLAELYGVDTKALNQAVKRNLDRFPESYRFQLTDTEKNELVTICDRFESLKHSTVNPWVFTEQGVAMLSAVLRSETAVKVSILVMNAFVHMRKLMIANGIILRRLDSIERKQLETDHKFEQVFKALESKDTKPEKGIFYEGQVFDAWTFVSGLIRGAKKSILLVDNFVDDTVLDIFTKRNENVRAIIYSKTDSKAFFTDLKKHNAQYPPVEVIHFEASHDRFLIIDETEIYHIGASLKDLGKKWFAFSKMDPEVLNLLNKLKIKGNE